ncbi:unnamed protein product, partial [Choristocarpus tenellus]
LTSKRPVNQERSYEVFLLDDFSANDIWMAEEAYHALTVALVAPTTRALCYTHQSLSELFGAIDDWFMPNAVGNSQYLFREFFISKVEKGANPILTLNHLEELMGRMLSMDL